LHCWYPQHKSQSPRVTVELMRKTHPRLAVNLVGHKLRLQDSYVFVRCPVCQTQRLTVELPVTRGEVYSTRPGACKVLIHVINAMINKETKNAPKCLCEVLVCRHAAPPPLSRRPILQLKLVRTKSMRGRSGATSGSRLRFSHLAVRWFQCAQRYLLRGDSQTYVTGFNVYIDHISRTRRLWFRRHLRSYFERACYSLTGSPGYHTTC